MKKLYYISIPILIVFNFINLNNGDLRLYGVFLIVSIFSFIGLVKNNYKSVLGLVSFIILIDFIIKLIIDNFGGYLTVTDEGQDISIIIQIMAQTMTLVVSIGIVSVFGVFKYLIKK